MSDSRNMPALSGTTRYRWPDESPPPRGVKLLIYTSGGVAIISDWSDDSNHTAWAPLPPKPVRVVSEPMQWTEEPDHGE
jgi:hypothetical protein